MPGFSHTRLTQSFAFKEVHLPELELLQQGVAKLFHQYDRGAITQNECRIRFVDILGTIPDLESANRICNLLPDWFKESFHQFLTEIKESGYYYTWTALEDARSDQQREQDSLRHQATLRRFASSMLATRRDTLQ